jgi:hypothetical protein
MTGAQDFNGALGNQIPDNVVPLPSASGSSRKSTASELVSLALDTWRFTVDSQGRPFAIPLRGPRIARPLGRGVGSLKTELARLFHGRTGRVPGRSSLDEALTVLEGEAAASSREDVYVRVGYDDDAIVIDLGDPSGQCIHIASDSVEIEARSPVLFRRTELTSELPIPVFGAASPDDLGKLLNVDPEGLQLLWGWLVSSLLDIPRPILLLTGEQGTGKTGAAKVISRLVDPSPAPVRAAPTALEQWVTAAVGSHVVALDNLSKIDSWFSDALCRAATGEGLVKRQLYTDDGIAVLEFRRSVILTSIEMGALRGDLGERLVPIELQVIPPSKRQTDAALEERFHELHPGMLAVLCDLTSRVLGEMPNVNLPCLPRMADFGRALAALDRVTGWSTLERYMVALENIADDVLAGDPLGAAIRQFLIGHGGRWSGTVSDLYPLLHDLLSESAAFPRTPKTLSEALKRLAPALRSNGIQTEFFRTKRSRTIELTLADPVDAGRVSASDASDADDALQHSVSVLGNQAEGSRRTAAASCGPSPASSPSPASGLLASASPLGFPSSPRGALTSSMASALAREYAGECRSCGTVGLVGAVTGHCRSCWPVPDDEVRS